MSFNYKEGHWTIGPIERTAGVDRGPLEFPLAADASGAVYEHEKGTTMADEGGSPTYTPNAETGAFGVGQGDHNMMVRQIIPDEATLADISMTIYASFYPTGTEINTGAITLTNPTDVRITGRQIRLKIIQVSTGWRFGNFRLDIAKAGGR